MQTFIDKYIEEGERKGRQEGRKEGRQEGRQQGLATVLLRRIELKFGVPSEDVRRRMMVADANALLRWSERVLTAEAPGDVFD